MNTDLTLHILKFSATKQTLILHIFSQCYTLKETIYCACISKIVLTRKRNAPANILLENAVLEWAEKFVYLGQVIQNDL